MNRILPLMALAALAAAPLRSGEPAVPTEAGREGLASASRELDLIKAVRDPAGQTRVPGLSLPEAAPPVLEAPAARSSLSPPARRPGSSKPSPGWLVEAMERKAAPGRDQGVSLDRRPRDDADRLSTSRQGPSSRADEETERGGAVDAEERRSRSERAIGGEQRTEPAFNPFQPFLQGWLTAGDLALMKPVVEANSPATPSLGRGGPATGSVPGAPWVAPLDVRPVASGLEARPRSNPYLEALNVPAASPASVAPLAAAREPVVVLPGPTTPVAAPEPARERPRTPPFVKPQEDEKLFRTLKRF